MKIKDTEEAASLKAKQLARFRADYKTYLGLYLSTLNVCRKINCDGRFLWWSRYEPGKGSTVGVCNVCEAEVRTSDYNVYNVNDFAGKQIGFGHWLKRYGLDYLNKEKEDEQEDDT